MAQLVLATTKNVAESIVADLVKQIVVHFGYNVFGRIFPTGDLESQIKSLRDVKSAIEATLLDADSAQVCNKSQRLVLETLERGLAELVSIQEKQATRAKRKALTDGNCFSKKFRLLLSAPGLIISGYRDAMQINEITEELSLITRYHAQYGAIIGSSSMTRTSLETGSHPCTDLVVGRDEDRDVIISTLLDSSSSAEFLSVASIGGIGGVGKTTLAQYVYHDRRISSCFDVQLWVSGTQEFDLKEVLKKILASATDEKLVDCEMDQLQRRLIQAIAGKKFLLVLDSIWDQDNLRAKWIQLRSLLRVGDRGSKVLITTRSETVARIMDACDPYKLSELGSDDSWLLFQHFAFTPGHESGVEAIGREISQMCPKLPLVIRAIGSLMAKKFTVQEWQFFKHHQVTNRKKLAFRRCPEWSRII